MKNINTLVEDIYGLFKEGVDLNDQLLSEFSSNISNLLKTRLSKKEIERKGDTLRMSNFGTNCDRKLWYTVNEPDTAEELSPVTRFKFLYGDLIEELVLFLTKAAGHQVDGQQDEMNLHGVKGHRDAVIDGVLVDVKSANSRGFEKFAKHRVESDDPFGYLHQLGMYLEASKDDPKVLVKGEAAFLAVDKELGKLVVDKYRKPKVNYEQEVKDKRAIIQQPEPPKRHYLAEPDGQSGNYKLNTQCAYCQFKHHCWADSNGGQGIRTFIYSTGPRFLVKVARQPDVPEVAN